jgi:hypothetical protein
MSGFLSGIHHALVYGALKNGGSWGGDECRAIVSNMTHFYESIAWNLIAILFYVGYDLKSNFAKVKEEIQLEMKVSKSTQVSRVFELALAMVHFLLYGTVIYYKANINSLINLIQPCHLILLLEGIALLDDGVLGTMITLYLQPALIGALLATVTPDVTGLDQPFEVELYFVQHILILVVPIFLLLRRNYMALKFCNFMSMITGLTMLTVAHFFFFEVIDLLLNVNVEFMLCPPSGVAAIFSVLPVELQILQWPSHRSTLTYVVMTTIWPLCYGYIYIASVCRKIITLATGSAAASDSKITQEQKIK